MTANLKLSAQILSFLFADHPPRTRKDLIGPNSHRRGECNDWPRLYCPYFRMPTDQNLETHHCPVSRQPFSQPDNATLYPFSVNR